MPKKITVDAVLLIVLALGISYVASVAVRDAGKQMGMTVTGTVMLGLLVGGAAHALPMPKPS